MFILSDSKISVKHFLERPYGGLNIEVKHTYLTEQQRQPFLSSSHSSYSSPAWLTARDFSRALPTGQMRDNNHYQSSKHLGVLLTGLSNFMQKMCYIPFSEHFSFAKIFHPLDRCGISISWLNSMVITQVHLVLGTIQFRVQLYRADGVVWASGLLMSTLWTECPMVAVGLWYGQEWATENKHNCILSMAIWMHRDTMRRSWGPLSCWLQECPPERLL